MNVFIEKLKEKKLIVKSIVLLIIPLIVEIIFSKKIIIEKSTLIRLGCLYAIDALYIIFCILNKYRKKFRNVLNFIIEKRYFIIVIVFILGLIFKINFSSINIWTGFLNETDTSSNILGVSREIRADEWLVQSTTMLAQTKNPDGYTMTNKHIMQGNCNILMTAGPVLNIATISKPLIWGFLIFGTEIGFAWWWMLRLILLLVVSFELARIITKKDNLLSILGMLMLGIAPGIMWWFSTAIVDSYIWGMAIIILFHHYMNNLDGKFYKKILFAIGMVISIPAFTFALYPAYQVPLAYIIAIFLLNDLIKNFKSLKWKDYLIVTITLSLSAGIILYFVVNAWTDIQTMMGTVYPGSRFELGGDFTIDQFVAGFTNLFLPYSKKIANPCEISGYLYPISGVLILVVCYLSNKNKEKIKKDSNRFLEIGLIVLYLFFFVWMYIGFNKTLSQITFLYFSPTKRTALVLGIIGTLLMLILLKRFENIKILNKRASIIISFIVTILVYVLIKNSSYAGYFSTIKLEIISALIFSITYSITTINKKAVCYILCITSIIAGATINPIVSGVDILYKTDIAKEIQKIYSEDRDALWIGRYNWSGQYLLANGVNVLNGVNPYPNFNWLDIVDPNGEYNEVYNRYAHIGVILSDHTEFRLLAQDSYEVELTYNNFKDLGVKYYFTDTQCSDEIVSMFNMSIKYKNTEKNQYIYQIN